MKHIEIIILCPKLQQQTNLYACIACEHYAGTMCYKTVKCRYGENNEQELHTCNECGKTFYGIECGNCKWENEFKKAQS